jgi:glycosyltransferase involved in cell wall biosynthesis
MPAEAQRLLFVVTEDWYFVSHRLALAVAARRAGYQVAVATRVRAHAGAVAAAGIELIELERWRRSSLNPLLELAAVVELAGVIGRWKPDIVHLVALKPVVYGGLAARIAGRAARVNALAGLGFVFSGGRPLARLLRPLVKLAFRWTLGGTRAVTIVQNPDDRDVLIRERLLDASQLRLIRGSGVDLARFAAGDPPSGRPIVLLISRMLWDKGVAEFVAAAGLARKRGSDARFVLAGDPDDESPGAVPRAKLQQWHDSGVIEWWGYRADAESVIAHASLVVLPSFYGEGVPKALLEAAACARPMVATDMPGCREVVEHDVTGLLVAPRDPTGLAEAVVSLLGNPARCREMGRRARELAEREFGIDAVTAATLDVYTRVVRS